MNLWNLCGDPPRGQRPLTKWMDDFVGHGLCNLKGIA